jgi:cytochrome c-type biogenesis protein CcmH/NrfF
MKDKEPKAVMAERDRIHKLICPACNNHHILDNGRVWAFCGLTRLIDQGESEQQAYADIRRRHGEAAP